MPGSDSSSVTSGAAGSESASIRGGGGGGAGHGPDQSDLLEHSQDIQAAVFGVVYTLSKEKYDKSKKFAVAKIALDFLQLLILIINPSYGWNIDEKLWIWRAMSYLQFKNPLIAKGYGFYITVLYITIACLVLGLCLCVWVGWCFKNDRFSYIWPIKVLRLVVSIFFVVFYIASLSVFLMALQCNYFSHDKAVRFTLDHYHNKCFQVPHLIHAGLALLAMIAFIFVSVVMTVADFELNPVSQSLLASPASVVELRAVVVKTVMTVTAGILQGKQKLQALVVVGSAWLLFWSYLRWMPHYNKWVNHARTALYAGLSWAGLLLLCLVFSKRHMQDSFQAQMTNALIGGLFPMMLAGFGLSYVRFEWFYRSGIRAFKNPDPKKKVKDIYKFTEYEQVEVLTRCCRVWVDEDTLDPDAVALAEFIIKAGIARLGTSPGLLLLYSNFLIEVQGLYQNGHSQLQHAKKMSPSISQRFVIFIREQEHRQKAQTSSSGESAVDLVSYVEFQRNYRTLVRCHKAALYATRNFWKQLLHHDVSFTQLTKSFSSIEGNEVRAEKTYKMVLERYPQSAKLLRSYGRFLEDVKHDPWGAAKYYSEADKVEEEADSAQNDAALDFSKGDAAGVMSQVDEKNSALILINASGIIQMANKLALKFFGYKKGELEGKNISMLMPNPFSQRHNTFLRNYITTGKAKILNSVREVVGMHKDRYVFPMKIIVTKVSGSGSDSTFMGVCMPKEDDTSVVNVWLMPNGTILCIDERFTDWFAKSHNDIVGKSIVSLAVEQDRVAELLEQAGHATEEDFNLNRLTLKGVKVIHKFTDSLECNLTLKAAGTENQRLMVLEIRRTDNSTNTSNLMVTDQKGMIRFVTSGFAHLLGYQPQDMVGKLGINNLMNAPFSHLHAKWLADIPAKIPANSCRNSATVVAVTSNGASVPVRMSITSREEADEVIHLVTLWKSTFEEGLDLRRLACHINSHGHINEMNSSPPTLFGFKPSVLVGTEVDSCIETMQDLIRSDGLSLSTLLQAMIVKVSERPGITWRVGVLPPPLTGGPSVDLKSTATASHGSQARPAVMHLEVTETNEDMHLCVHLHRSDSITGIIEVDRDGRISKAGCCPMHMPGIIFGVSSPSMVRLPLGAFIDLGGRTPTEALLGETLSKGALKMSAGSGIKLGPVRKLHGRHMDGESLTVQVQACPKDAQRRRLVVKINVSNPSTGDAGSLRRSIIAEDGPSNADAKDTSRGGSIDIDMGTTGNHTGPPMDGMPIPEEAPFVEPGEAGTLVTVDSVFGANLTETQDMNRVKAWVLSGADGPALKAVEDVQPERQLGIPKFQDQPEFEAGDNQSQVSGDQSHISASENGDGANNQQSTDYRKGKRYKKLRRLLAGKTTQAAVDRFHTHTLGVLAFQLLAHLACFIVFTSFIKSLHEYVYEVDASGRANDMLHRVAMNALLLREHHRGRDAPGIYSTADIPARTALMAKRVDEFEFNHRGIFLGFKRLRRLRQPLKDTWELPNLNVSYYADLENPVEENQTMSLWQLGNHYIMSAREVMSNQDRMAGSATFFGPNSTDLQINRHWYFVVNNGPAVLFDAYKQVLGELLVRAMGQVRKVNQVNVILLVVEGCLVGVGMFLYMWIIIKRVINMRYKLFSTFLSVPAGFLRILASKQVQVDEDGDGDSDSDDGDGGNYEANTQANKEAGVTFNAGDNAKPAPPMVLATKSKLALTYAEAEKPVGLVQTAWTSFRQFWTGDETPNILSKRKLRRDARDITLVLAPFVIWSALVLVIYAITYNKLKSTVVSGMIDNSIASTVDFRITRVIYFALKFCSRETPALKEDVRPLVALSSLRLHYAYESLMYGTLKEYDDSRYRTPGTTFKKGAPVKYFFRARGRCWRTDKSQCFNSSSEYYEISHNGIDAMMTRMVEDAGLLSQDDVGDINVSSPRLAYIWKVGNFDLHEGMQQASSAYSSRVLASFQGVLDMHIILFVLSWVLSFIYVIFVFKPFLKRVQEESRRVAELLSQLPADMDVEGLVEQALGKGNGKEASRPGDDKAKAMANKDNAVDGILAQRQGRASFSIPAAAEEESEEQALQVATQPVDSSDNESTAYD